MTEIISGNIETRRPFHRKGLFPGKHWKPWSLGIAALLAATALIQGQANLVDPLSPASLREWLTVIASDEFEGRATFAPGLDKAAAYISERIKEAGVKPGGDDGSYLQRVEVQTVQSSNQSSMTVEVRGESRTFRNGDGVHFPGDVGGKREFTLNEVEFVGYGLHLGSGYSNYADRNVKGKVVVWLGDSVPEAAVRLASGRTLESRASTALDEMNAAASISLGGRQRGNSSFTTTQRLDLPRAPAVTVSEDVLEFLFSASGLDYRELKRMASRREPLPTTTIRDVKVTFNLDAEYRVSNSRVTQNVVGLIEGTDPKFKETYVAFGAHYDHMGVSQNLPDRPNFDRIHNGADDDGSGTVALIGLARRFMSAKPRRSLLFVWHAGEERGLWGSQYLADHPPVPAENIVAQLNIDMIGRNRDNKESEENTVYPVGADRISTDLHNTLVEANSSLSAPLTLDFEMNDPADPERIYFRSDHFSYAAKGIPVIFFFTGLHPDYHQVTDSVDKILFEKLSRITGLVYEVGRRVAEAENAPARDFKGARIGRGSSGKLETR